MGTTSPPILPITNLQSTTNTTTPPATDDATPAQHHQQLSLPALVHSITQSLRHGLSQRKPWSELLDRTAFSKPESVSEAGTRIRKNYLYFRINYLAILSSILAFSLVFHPFSLLALLALLASWLLLYLFRPSDRPLVLLGRTFSDIETLGCFAVMSIVVVFMTNVGSVIISALLVGVAVVCAHGAFRVPEDLFLDQQQPSASTTTTTGFLSFLA